MKTLIIEDDAETAAFIAAGLRSRGHEPTLAADGREGFEIAAHETFDVIILDRMLPGLDGLSVVALLRAEGVSTPVLFLTNLSGVDDRVEGLGAGGDDYLVKPFAFEELLARLYALARRPTLGGSPTRLAAGDLEVDLIARTVKRADRRSPFARPMAKSRATMARQSWPRLWECRASCTRVCRTLDCPDYSGGGRPFSVSASFCAAGQRRLVRL